MTRTLLVPAAGHGTRLRSPHPKLLTPVVGRAMIDHVIDRHRPYCQEVVLVVTPAHRDEVARHCASFDIRITLVVQPAPTGMLDAVVVGRDAIEAAQPDRIWITWCDQLALSSTTVGRLAELDRNEPRPAAVLPTSRQPDPYIHFVRDEAGKFASVRQRREGDAMPEMGESDAGLFSLSRQAYLEQLAEYARIAERGARTGERNFLPFLPWLARSAEILTFPVDSIESAGINTPEELDRIERYLTLERRN